MKKYLIALFFGMSLMTMQTVSAATLGLQPDNSNQNGVDRVEAHGLTGNTGWHLNIGGGPTNVFFVTQGGPTGFWSTGTENPLPIGNALHNVSGILNLFFVGAHDNAGGLVPYSFAAFLESGSVPVTGEVPVPAAVWLFGSALMGLFGIGRRKSQSALAA